MTHFHLLLLLLSALITVSFSQKILRIFPGDTQITNGNREWINNDLFCDSWRLSVETNNAGYWATIPARCRGFVEAYMKGDHYVSDSEVVAVEAIYFARDFDIAGNGKDAWIFDVDETLLSNLPYYIEVDFGSEPFNETSFDEWVELARAPALPASLKLYNELQRLGFSLVLLTGRSETQRNSTEKNLLFAGYKNWERLILREASDIGKSALIYKSEKRAQLEAEGFVIHGSSGDQWSDLYGPPMATRSFKLPNPMYFIK
ncbi:acid phosphatase 1 [Dendrobium catenatum]|uniref:Acid phosphatase 1 n=1 Tax=Dendrobium catenatum TaxID=906689 RepID=A0A2I0X6R4_9ASPA|nr:acid phosphatase 1 [Dendrobium catenatum]PKU83604.1 Acid phosphatase 1 [Dendrobium catenatum]